MAEAVVVALLAVLPLVGLVSRRWSTLMLPLLGWPLYYVGLHRGWWGNGTGDGWEYAAVSLTAVGVGITAVAVALGTRSSRAGIKEE